MNKSSKIFLVIVIILIIPLVTSIYFCFKYAYNTQVTFDYLIEVMKAIENKGLKLEKQEDSTTLVLVEREGKIEESID